MKKRLIFLAATFLFLTCQRDGADQWQTLDLMSYGIPVAVEAPDSATVQVGDLGGGLIKDITIRGGDDYYIQLYASGAETTDIAKIKSSQLSDVKSNRYFTKIVEEEDAGFLYETQIDSTLSYGFRYIRVQGDMECVFQTGLVGTFTLDEARRMYEAVKPK